MTETQRIIHELGKGKSVVSGWHRAQTPINHILERLSPLELPAKEQLANYLRHKSRLNHKRRTLDSSFTSTVLFLDFYGKSGKSDLKDLERADLEAFIEHEQDRGLKISTVKTRMAFIMAFLHFLVEQNLIPGTALKKTIRFKLPDALPRGAPKNLSDFFRIRARRKVDRDRTVTLNGRIYEAPVELIEKNVNLLYHDDDPQRIEISCQDQSYGFLVPLNPHINARIKRNAERTDIEPQPTSPPLPPMAKSYQGGILFERRPNDESL